MEQQEKVPSALQGYPQWHKKPFRLSNQEMAEPIGVIEEYFNHFHLDDVREHFRDFFSDALQADEPRPDHHMYFQEQTEKCIEAAYCLQEQGIVPLNSQRQKKRHDFLYDYLDEIDGHLFKIRELVKEIEACKDHETNTFTAQAEHHLLKIDIITSQVLSAQSSMMTMLSDDQPTVVTNTPKTNPVTVKTDRLIQDCADRYYSYQSTFNKSLSVRVDPLAPFTVSYRNADLEVLLETLMDAAFLLCQEGGGVSLVCSSQSDAISITVSMDVRTVIATEKEHFPAYELFADSTIAGAHLYVSDQIASDMGASLQYWSSGIRTHFKLTAPLEASI